MLSSLTLPQERGFFQFPSLVSSDLSQTRSKLIAISLQPPQKLKKNMESNLRFQICYCFFTTNFLEKKLKKIKFIEFTALHPYLWQKSFIILGRNTYIKLEIVLLTPHQKNCFKQLVINTNMDLLVRGLVYICITAWQDLLIYVTRGIIL